MLNRLHVSFAVFWAMLTGRTLSVAHFRMILDAINCQTYAKVTHETREWRSLQFVVKLYKPSHVRKKKVGNAWGV